MNNFDLIVAGGRTFTNYDLLNRALSRLLSDKLRTHNVRIVSGTARGADQLGERFAALKNLEVISCPADWDTHGKSAGYKRNAYMASIADACVVFWDGQSRGSKHMIDLATKSIPTRVITYHA